MSMCGGGWGVHVRVDARGGGGMQRGEAQVGGKGEELEQYFIEYVKQAIHNTRGSKSMALSFK